MAGGRWELRFQLSNSPISGMAHLLLDELQIPFNLGSNSLVRAPSQGYELVEQY